MRLDERTTRQPSLDVVVVVVVVVVIFSPLTQPGQAGTLCDSYDTKGP